MKRHWQTLKILVRLYLVELAEKIIEKYKPKQKEQKCVPPFQRTQSFSTVVPPEVERLMFSLHYDPHRDHDKTRFLEALKSQVMREIERNFFYYFPVKHNKIGYMNDEEHMVEFYFKKHFH